MCGWVVNCYSVLGGCCCFVGGARRFSLENARAIAVYKSPEQRA